MTLRRSPLVLACFLLLLPYARTQATLNSSATGEVSGTLLTSDGKPASGYTVDLVGTSQTSTARVHTRLTETASS